MVSTPIAGLDRGDRKCNGYRNSGAVRVPFQEPAVGMPAE
jgi:hypothetical protein